jgi:4-hydroxy-tetrahydrodipicolinate reductase
MKIGLIGYGKMGHAIERLAALRKHTVAWKVDAEQAALLPTLLPEVDVAIEFTQPEVAYHNVYTCLQNHTPVICGTTGWLERKAAIDQYCLQQEGTFFYATNFSLAMQLFFKLNRLLATYLNLDDFKITIEETHAPTKKDKPSGTALRIVENITETTLHQKETSPTSVRSIPILSHRLPDSMGQHIVRYSSPLEEITLEHLTKSRDSLAQGVILVAEWLQGKKGVLTMDDFLAE